MILKSVYSKKSLVLFLHLTLFSVFQQKSYALQDYFTWKEIKSKFRWSTTNVLWCRYKTPSGKMFENAGRTANHGIMTYSYLANEENFYWSCPDINDPLSNRHSCPHLLTDGRYNYSNTWFLVNDAHREQLRADFIHNAIASCEEYTPHHNYEFIEFGIKSTADFFNTFFHRPLYTNVPKLSANFPFSRIVVFGDSLTDTGNSFSTLSYPQWPYFMGRFSNGPVWVEYLTQSLIHSENNAFDLYNYAVGGGGVTNPSYNPFGIFYKQVKSYLESMEQGQENKLVEPGYESTLFVIFIGSNDYMTFTQNTGLLGKLLYCAESEPAKCAQLVVDGIKKEIENILALTKNRAKYFVIPVQPDMTLAPYYQKLTGAAVKERTFLANAIKAHNKYLKKALDQIEKSHPGIEILRLDLDNVIFKMVKDPSYNAIIESKITNTKDACFSGSAKNIKNQTFCDDPASYMFWDGVHLTTTTNCVLGEYSVSQIYKAFAYHKTDYMPQYERCHLNDITHEKP